MPRGVGTFLDCPAVLVGDINTGDADKFLFAAGVEKDALAAQRLPKGARIVVNPNMTCYDGDLCVIEYQKQRHVGEV